MSPIDELGEGRDVFVV